MRIPDTTRTPAGFTVEGAGPDLLRELLREYAKELKRTSRTIYDAMLPGLPKAQIEDDLGAIGLVPPPEAIEWWHWRNGMQQMVPTGLKHAQLPLAAAISVYQTEELGTSEYEWNPDWIRIAGGGNTGDAMNCRPGESPPRVRAVSTFNTGTQDDEDPIHQVVSLCTPVAWWILALKNGWDRLDPVNGWLTSDDSLYPIEWKLTLLM